VRIIFYIPFIVIAGSNNHQQLLSGIEEYALIAIAYAGHQLTGFIVNRIIKHPELVSVGAIIAALHLRLK
jgi:hypothetical protein